MTRRDAPKYDLRIYWSREDNMFVAGVPDLPGCIAHGDTPTEAAANATAAIAAWISTAREVGREVPEPTRHQALV